MSLKFYIGDFSIHSVSVGNATINLSFLSPLNQTQKSKIVRWVTKSLTSVKTVTGDLPFKELQVAIVDVNRKTSGPTPFATVNRGEGTHVIFYINKFAPEPEYMNDWTAYHEFSHLLLPFIDRRDAWLSEGFASYYQYLVMGREKVLSSQMTFNRLWGGVQRGLENYPLTQNRSLYSASKNMKQLRSHRRVYWSGALIWLEADIALHKRGSSLNKILKEFHACCFDKHPVWTSEELAGQLDSLAEEKIFSSLFDKARSSHQFPDYVRLLDELGISINKDKSLLFRPSPIRESLISP